MLQSKEKVAEQISKLRDGGCWLGVLVDPLGLYSARSAFTYSQ